MQSVTFTCVKNAEQQNKALKQSRWIKYLILFFAIAMCGFCVFLSYIVIPDISNSPLNGENIVMWICIIISIIVMLLLSVFCIVAFLKNNETVDMMFDIIADKVFGWDDEKKQLFYKDKYRTIYFKGDDVKKWVSMNNKGNTTTDIIQLINGEQFVIESFFNPNVYSFLHENKERLNLPRPKLFSFVINYYKDSI